MIKSYIHQQDHNLVSTGSDDGHQLFFMENQYYKGLPKKRMGVGALFFNDKDELLILKPTYKDYWSIPGGIIDANESPREACICEIKKEIGLNISDVRFLCVDYYRNLGNEKGESLQFMFYGGILSESQISNIKIPREEIGGYKFMHIENVLPLFSNGLQKRMPKCLEAIKSKISFYLEDAETPKSQS